MPSRILYPPIVDSETPAFIAGENAYCRVYFSLSKFNNDIDFTGDDNVQIIVFNQSGGKNVINAEDGISPARYRSAGIILDVTPIQVSADTYYVDINNNDIKDGWQIDNIYKIQLRLSSVKYTNSSITIAQSTWLGLNANNFSEWSTINTTKAIYNITIKHEIPNMDTSTWTLSSSSFVYSGRYESTLTSEPLYSYKISLLEDEDILEESPLIYAEHAQESTQFLNYVFKTELKNTHSYSMELKFETINKYSRMEQIDFTVAYSSELFDDISLLTIENNINGLLNSLTNVYKEEEDGRVFLKLYSELDSYTGTICIRRSDYTTNFTKWEDFKIITFNNQDVNEYPPIYDFTIESGVFYKYGIQEITSGGGRTELNIIENPAIRTFNYSFLLGEDNRQLRLTFNNEMNNYRYSLSENNIETIGSKFPFFDRNAEIYYQTFPITGLISFNMDENNLFTTREELFGSAKILYDNYRANNNISLYDMTYEREFRKKVLDFLQNGKYKLFKSPSEGNVIIRLKNVSCTPNKTTNRLIYSFSAEALEVAENNYENYLKYNFHKSE